MKEIWKTVGFAGVALLIVSAAWLSRPASPVTDAQGLQGELLFPDFVDPLTATSMEIVEFDEETAEPRPFTVAQVDVKGEGKPLWAIPTHQNYPADEKGQVADAAAGLMDLKIRKEAGSRRSDHEVYGVRDPDPKKRKGTKGVGTRVTMKDNRGRVLMSLIVGKEVPDRSELRYVRKVDEDPVYIVKVSTDKLSSKFEDWIEEDLLKLSAWDLKQIQIRDHSVDELNMQLIQRGEMTLQYDDTGDDKWKLAKDEAFQDGQWVPRKMAEDQELDTDKLDDMKNALDDLEIVDVRRKPPGLSGDLNADKSILDNNEALASLMGHGFYPGRIGDRIELVSNEGEIRCLMKDGVEYVLRFGQIATDSVSRSAKKEGEDEGSGSSGLNRYIFVMVEFNRDLIPKPEFEPLPDEEEKPANDEAAKGPAPEEEKNKEEKNEEEKDPDQPSEEKPAAEAAEEKSDGQSTEEKADDGALQKNEEKTDDDSAEEKTVGDSAEEKTDDRSAKEKTDDRSAEENEDKTDSEAAEDNGKQVDDAADDDEPDPEQERERIRKENKDKQREYDNKIEEGRKNKDELNERFADWYYIISDEVYQKIHLGRDQIVKKKEKEKEEEDGEENGGKNGDHKAETDPGEADAVEGPEEPTSPVSEFKKLRQEGPGGGEGNGDDAP